MAKRPRPLAPTDGIFYPDVATVLLLGASAIGATLRTLSKQIALASPSLRERTGAPVCLTWRLPGGAAMP